MRSSFYGARGRVGALRFLAAIGVVSALAAGVYYGAPLELARVQSRWELWRSGVTHRVWPGELRVLERDFCGGSTGAQTECECVLLVHGLGDDAMTWKRLLRSDRSTWIRPSRLMAPDLPGSGDSPAPADPASGYRVSALAARLAEGMAAETGCSHWVVAGNSLGGWIAARMAIDYPAQIHRLVLIGASGFKAHFEAGSAQLALLTNVSVESLQEFQARAYHRPRDLPPHVWQAVVRRAKRGNSRAVRAAQSDADFLDGKLARIQAPTFLLWGESDRISPPELGRAFEREIPGAHLKTVAECGHLPQKECADAVVSMLNSAMLYGVM